MRDGHLGVEVSLSEELLRQTIEDLPDVERKVIRLRYGINGDEPQPLRETGRRLGLSAERVRQLESKALKRLATRREPPYRLIAPAIT